MKKILLVGNVGCGKTTLCQRLNGLKCEYKKTQAIEAIHQTIDTPGEYLERRALLHALLVTASEAELVCFVLDPTQERYMYAPGQAAAFPVPVIGIITKLDLAAPEQIENARQLLQLTGVETIFEVSAQNDENMEPLIDFLNKE